MFTPLAPYLPRSLGGLRVGLADPAVCGDVSRPALSDRFDAEFNNAKRLSIRTAVKGGATGMAAI